jgi:hypothetical protein
LICLSCSYQLEELNSELDLRLHLHGPRASRAEQDVHNVRAGKFDIQNCLHRNFKSYVIFIKYVRYNARSDWSNICDMSVYSRGQRLSAHACTFHVFKVFCKSNIKRLLVYILGYKHYGCRRALEVKLYLSKYNAWLRLLLFVNFFFLFLAELILHRERVDRHCRGITTTLNEFKTRFHAMVDKHDREVRNDACLTFEQCDITCVVVV